MAVGGIAQVERQVGESLAGDATLSKAVRSLIWLR